MLILEAMRFRTCARKMRYRLSFAQQGRTCARETERNKMVKHIIFDMDGTLVDSAQVSIAACRAIAPQFNLAVLPPETIQNAIGYANPDFYYQLYSNEEKNLLHKYSAAVEAYEAEIIRDFTGDLLFPDIRPMLQELATQGYPLYIASTGDSNHVFDSLTKGNIIHHFEKIYCNRPFVADHNEVNHSDAGYNKEMSRIHFCEANSNIKGIHTNKADMLSALMADSDPAEWLMVGDKEKDASAARKNNVTSICFRFGYGTAKEHALFDYIVDSPMEFIQLLQAGSFMP